MLISAIAIILVLGALIFFHELGHFLVAKSFRIGVRTFSLGFGPKLLAYSTSDTEYRISAVPLGGYVQLVGESPDAELPTGYSDKSSFSLRPAWQRMLVVGAGPVFNFLLAWVIYACIFMALGQQAMLPTIGEVQEKTPAAEAGLKAGDRVVSINGREVEYWHDMAQRIRKSGGRTLQMTLVRDATRVRVTVTPEMQTAKNVFGEEVRVPRIGVVAAKDVVHVPMGPLESVWGGLEQTGRFIALTCEALVKIVARVVPLKTIGGPIMIAQLVSEQADRGIVDVLALTAVISINLGLLNLLPIPVLDGGHILFYGLETVLRRPVDPKWREVATKIGLTLLITLMALAIYNDIFRILQGG
jgi:regulator of sigma E protease